MPGRSFVSTLLALVLLLPVSSTAGAMSPMKPVSVTRNSLSVTVDPRVELLSIVQYLSDYKNINRNLVTNLNFEYRKDVDKRFAGFKNDPVMEMFNSMASKGFSYDAPPHAVLYLDDDLSLNQVVFKDYAQGVQRAGGKKQMAEFADALKLFAAKSDFARFFNSHIPLYEKMIDATLNNIQHKDTVEVLEQYYGEKRHSFSIVISPLLGGGSFGPEVELKKGVRDIYCIMGPSREQDAVPLFGSTGFFNQLQRHEFGHSFVNPLTAKYPSECKKYSSLFPPIKDLMSKLAYGTWENVVNESIIRAVTTRLAYRLDGQEAGDKELQNHKNQGFIFTGTLVKKLETYEQNRAKYPTLDSFYPELLKAFDGFTESSVAEALKSGPAANMVINNIVIGAQCLVYDLPKDDARADALGYITKVHDMFFDKIKMLDVQDLNDSALKDKDDFAVYTTIGSKLFNAATQPLHVQIKDGRLQWNGIDEPISDLRIILIGINPYGPGYCVVYAGGSNKLVKGINGCYHGPCSYHIFQGDKLLKEGYYGRDFVLK